MDWLQTRLRQEDTSRGCFGNPGDKRWKRREKWRPGRSGDVEGDFLVLELILLSDCVCGVGKKEASKVDL